MHNANSERLSERLSIIIYRITVGHVTERSWVRFPLKTSFFLIRKKFFCYYKPSFVFIYLLAYNVYPSLDPVYFFEAYIGASCLFNRTHFHILMYLSVGQHP